MRLSTIERGLVVSNTTKTMGNHDVPVGFERFKPNLVDRILSNTPTKAINPTTRTKVASNIVRTVENHRI